MTTRFTSMRDRPVVQLTLIGLREVNFKRRSHPSEGAGWCSCCREEPVSDGVMVTGKDPKPFYFLCLRCARAIAAVST